MKQSKIKETNKSKPKFKSLTKAINVSYKFKLSSPLQTSASYTETKMYLSTKKNN